MRFGGRCSVASCEELSCGLGVAARAGLLDGALQGRIRELGWGAVARKAAREERAQREQGEPR